MAPDLREIINKIDLDNQNRSELEQRLNYLRNENLKLRQAIKEQKFHIESLEKENLEEFPGEVQILKEMVISLRQKIEDKDKLIQNIRINNIQLLDEINSFKAIKSHEILQEEIEELKKDIIKLTQANEKKKLNIEILRNELEEAKTEREFDVSILKKEIEVINREKLKLIEEISQLKKEPETQVILIDDNTQSDNTISNFDRDNLYRENEINELNKYIQNLKLQINELRGNTQYLKREKKDATIKQASIQLETGDYLSMSYQINLIKQIFSLLQEKDQRKFLSHIFTDLRNRNFDVKRFIIKLLSHFKTFEVQEELIKYLKDDNWLIRISVLHALKKFNLKGLKNVLKSLQNDPDIDVKEFITRMLVLK